MNKEIIKGNEFIAKFVGAKIITEYEDHSLFDYGMLLYSKDEEIVKLFPENKRYVPSSVMKYHSSWDWLIPVVEKIEKLGYSVTIGTSFRKDKSQRIYCEISTAEMWNFELAFIDSPEPIVEVDELNFNSKIKNVWLAVVEFIKWYNDNKIISV